jgi:hypothetical protein
MLEQAITVALHKINLMLTAYLVHRPDVVDRMNLRHFRQGFVEQTRFGSSSIEHFFVGEQDLLAHQPACVGQTIKCWFRLYLGAGRIDRRFCYPGRFSHECLLSPNFWKIGLNSRRQVELHQVAGSL